MFLRENFMKESKEFLFLKKLNKFSSILRLFCIKYAVWLMFFVGKATIGALQLEPIQLQKAGTKITTSKTKIKKLKSIQTQIFRFKISSRPPFPCSKLLSQLKQR
jgi:hypothetical protein